MDQNVEQIIAAAQLVTENMGQSQGAMSIYLTVTSGYLLVAYLVGKDLTRLQVTIITSLFVFFAGLTTFGVMSYMESAVYFGHTYGAGRIPIWIPYPTAIVFGGGIAACLKFMWDVRHAETE